MWFKEELSRRGMIQSIVGLGCSPVLVKGSKKVFLKWIGRALRQKSITLPESSGPVRWSLASVFFGVDTSDREEGSAEGRASQAAGTIRPGD